MKPHILALLSDHRMLAHAARGLAGAVSAVFRRAGSAVSVTLGRLFRRGWVPGTAPSLANFVLPLADAAGPLLEPAYRRGIEAFEGAGVGFGGLRPEVLVAVDRASLSLAASTLETAQGDVSTVLERLRGAIKEGLAAGEALSEATARISEIFKDLRRARRIAATEYSRAVWGGWFIRAKASGVRGKRWVTSGQCCELCASLAAIGVIPLMQPFYVNPKGGDYAVIQHVPAHPGCLCHVLAVEEP